MLIGIYHVLKDNVPFKDLGSNYFNQFNRERKVSSLVKKIIALGYRATVTAIPDAIA